MAVEEYINDEGYVAANSVRVFYLVAGPAEYLRETDLLEIRNVQIFPIEDYHILTPENLYERLRFHSPIHFISEQIEGNDIEDVLKRFFPEAQIWNVPKGDVRAVKEIIEGIKRYNSSVVNFTASEN
ncbi:MAG: hypothetical protein ACOCXG_03970 [Nanoarchaeota archaeon]